MCDSGVLGDVFRAARELKARHLMRRWRLMCASTWRTPLAPRGATGDVGGHVPAHRTHPRAKPQLQLLCNPPPLNP
jgi:hypothetical protein